MNVKNLQIGPKKKTGPDGEPLPTGISWHSQSNQFRVQWSENYSWRVKYFQKKSDAIDFLAQLNQARVETAKKRLGGKRKRIPTPSEPVREWVPPAWLSDPSLLPKRPPGM